MKIGFTGTQEGLTNQQVIQMRRTLVEHEVLELHHGDCIGADLATHCLAEVLMQCGHQVRIVLHPPSDPKKRAFCPAHEIRPTFPYIVRNHNIVDAVEYMLAAPSTQEEIVRSGTWATIRYAKKQGVPLRIIYPDGTSSYYNQESNI